MHNDTIQTNHINNNRVLQQRENTGHFQDPVIAWCKRAAVPLVAVLLADVIVALVVFYQYFWLKQAPASLITAKVGISIFEYVSYPGLCLFASRNITSFFNQTPIRSLFQERQGMHRVLVSQAIVSVVVHAIAHGFYNNKEFSWPIGVTGLALLSIMVLGSTASYGIYVLLENYRHKNIKNDPKKGKILKTYLPWLDKRLNYAKFETAHKFLAASALVLYLLHIGLPGINEASWGVSPNVSNWSRLIAWGGAIMVACDKVRTFLKRKTIYGIEPKTLRLQEKVLEDGKTERIRTMSIDIPMSKYKVSRIKPGANYRIAVGNSKEEHPYTVGISEEGKLNCIMKTAGSWTRKTTDLLGQDEEDPNNISIRLSGPYYDSPLCSITGTGIDKAAIIVGGTGISFLNSYLNYQRDNGRCPLYLVIKQNCDDIKLITETGTLKHILNLAKKYKEKYKDNYQKFFKVVIAISGTNDKPALDKLRGKIEDLNVDISIECTHCPSTQSDSFDAFILQDIKKFLNPNNTKNHNPSIFFCGPPGWEPSLQEKAIREECPFIAECYGSKTKSRSGTVENYTAIFKNINQDKRNSLISNDLIYQPILGDGHCLYNAVGLYCEQDQQTLRNIVAAKIRHNLNEYRNFINGLENLNGRTINDYLRDVESGKEWADNMEIVVLMKILDRPIVIVEHNNTIRNLSDIENDGEPRFSGEPIFVYYNGRDHYDALLKRTPTIIGKDILNKLKDDNGVLCLEPRNINMYRGKSKHNEWVPKDKGGNILTMFKNVNQDKRDEILYDIRRLFVDKPQRIVNNAVGAGIPLNMQGNHDRWAIRCVVQ